MSIHTQGFGRLRGRTLAPLAMMLAAGVSVFAVPAHAELILSGTGNCSTGTLGTTGTTTNQVQIGCTAVGSLQINANATGNGFTTATVGQAPASVSLVSGYLPGGNGTVLVNGNGTAGSAKLNTATGIEVGNSGGTGALTVQNGGQVTVLTNSSGMTIGNSNSNGTVIVDGAGSSITLPGHLGIAEQDGATASLTISGGALVQTTYNRLGAGFGNGNIGVGAGLGSNGSLTVTGTGSTLTGEGMFLGSTPAGSTATATVSAGGTINLNAINSPVANTPFDDGLSVGADAGATLNITGAGSTVNVSKITTGFLSGKEVVIGGFAAGTVVVDNGGALNALGGGNVLVSGGAFGNQFAAPATLTVKNGGSLTAGTVTVNQNGTLNGNGTLNANVVLNGGTLSPGNSPGTETINGNLSLLSGVLNLEIASDSLADHLNVTGNVSVGSGLVINLIFEYVPAFNKVFSFESFFTPTGSMIFDPSFSLAQFNVQGLAPGNAVILTANGAGAQFEAAATVPEPASIALLLTGLAGIGFTARRRRKARA